MTRSFSQEIYCGKIDYHSVAAGIGTAHNAEICVVYGIGYISGYVISVPIEEIAVCNKLCLHSVIELIRKLRIPFVRYAVKSA